MTEPSSRRNLTRAERARAAANAVASVWLDGLDPSTAEADLAAWGDGEIDTDELIRRGLEDARRGVDADTSA